MNTDGKLGMWDLAWQVDGLSDFVRARSDGTLDGRVGIASERFKSTRKRDQKSESISVFERN